MADEHRHWVYDIDGAAQDDHRHHNEEWDIRELREQNARLSESLDDALARIAELEERVDSLTREDDE
jgi:hypothetical protein